jgi:hypothetical protein
MLRRLGLVLVTSSAVLLSAGMVKAQSSAVNEKYAKLAPSAGDGVPLIDFHTHLKGGLTIDDVLAHTRSTGIVHGVAPNCGQGFPITSDEGIDKFLEEMQGKPVFLGMQAEGREWVNMFSKEAVARFDYVFSDAMTFTDHRGKRTRLWIPKEVDVPDPEAFMEMYVAKIVGVIADEPIDIYANPTFLPAVIAHDYDRLWTKARMARVIDAAAANGVAIEINARYRLPKPAFIQLAKAKGVKFTFGTNNSDQNMGQLEYCREMIRECRLTASDMFVPKPDGQKRVQSTAEFPPSSRRPARRATGHD